MTDPLAAIGEAFAHPTVSVFFSVFLGGLVTSIGPCIAPRYVAIAALAGSTPRSTLLVATFTLGLIATYVSFGWIAGALGTLWTISSAMYAVLAIGLIAGGLWTIVTPPRDHAHASSPPRSLGAALLLGIASAFVASPCCTPIVASVVSYSAIAGKPLFGALLLFSFACGHVAPLAAIGCVGRPLRTMLSRLANAQAPAIASGVLMLALGLLYGAMA